MNTPPHLQSRLFYGHSIRAHTLERWIKVQNVLPFWIFPHIHKCIFSIVPLLAFSWPLALKCQPHHLNFFYQDKVKKWTFLDCWDRLVLWLLSVVWNDFNVNSQIILKNWLWPPIVYLTHIIYHFSSFLHISTLNPIHIKN